MEDLKAFRVPVLILSGGEPLLRPDIFDIGRRAKEMGLYVGLSSNGTLINAGNIELDGALVIYDARSLEEVKRIPRKKSVGKYNDWNNITREESTSH